MTLAARALASWPALVILLGIAASVAWTGFILWAALQALRWLFD